MNSKGLSIAAIAVMGVVSCGKPSPVEEDKRMCRRYASAYTQNGQPYTCTYDDGFGSLTCVGGSLVYSTYRSAADFVHEAQVPNRVLALSRSDQRGIMLLTSSSIDTRYQYDPSGRMVERRRTQRLGNRVLPPDVTEYTAWDLLGRPIAGILRAGDRSEPIAISYNDTLRRMDVSNGEAVVLDRNGNVVRETVVLGFGAPSVVDYVVQSTTELCLPE